MDNDKMEVIANRLTIELIRHCKHVDTSLTDAIGETDGVACGNCIDKFLLAMMKIYNESHEQFSEQIKKAIADTIGKLR